MKKIFYLSFFVLCLAGCYPDVQITHSPVIAKSNEQVTFTAKVVSDGDGPCTVQIIVNAALVQTCNGLSTGDTCAYTGGPYPAYEGTAVAYAASVTDSDGDTKSRGYYHFSITDSSYNWSSYEYLWARITGDTADKEDLVFHRGSDYASFGDFIDDVEDKLYDVYDEQDIIEDPGNFDTFNFYVYKKVAADTDDCGIVHADADADMPWRDDDAILHTTDFGDCTNAGLSHFSAEGHNTKAFLHESGHGVFGMGDEYDDGDCSTGYFQPADEPNIWDTEAECRTEQTNKGRDPNACFEFTACSGGWWGIHDLSIDTVMQNGMVNEPWGTEATEHVEWYFDQF